MKNRIATLLAVSGIGAAALWIPDCGHVPAVGSANTPFVWNQDDVFKALEQEFVRTRATGCAAGRAETDQVVATVQSAVGHLELDSDRERALRSADAALGLIFKATARAAACPDRIREVVGLISRFRFAVRGRLDPARRIDRDRAYRLLYGSRAALEELLLQHGADPALAVELNPFPYRPPNTRDVEHRGAFLLSGDILLSRGGAPTSALIARGNDHPGNFSHVALLHIDQNTGEASVVESHIEQGVTVSSFAKYLSDQKLRILVLRLRPELSENGDIPKRAARAALERANSHHTPYDFEMNGGTSDRMFCSEVASFAYASQQVKLWDAGGAIVSSMSGRGVVRWLSSFGARYFETLAPADIEYDPKLQLVAEWRDAQALIREHADNAIIDVMLEDADRGAIIEHNAGMLGLARLAKAYSVLLNLFGRIGPVPEGMSATVALRAEWLRAEHARRRSKLADAIREFERAKGYRPPYWELLRLTRQNR